MLLAELVPSGNSPASSQYVSTELADGTRELLTALGLGLTTGDGERLGLELACADDGAREDGGSTTREVTTPLDVAGFDELGA